MPTRDDLRNVAIIAHVDHGKTTLVDALLLLVLRVGAGLQQHRVDQRGLAVVDVGDDRHVAEVIARGHAKSRFSFGVLGETSQRTSGYRAARDHPDRSPDSA